MRNLVSIAAAIAVIALLGLAVSRAGAQSPTPGPSSPTSLVVTATPMPQVIVVTSGSTLFALQRVWLRRNLDGNDSQERTENCDH